MHQPKVCKNLLRMNRLMPFRRFEFDEQAIADQQVGLECVVYDHALILQRHIYLSDDPQPFILEDSKKHLLVSRFEQARPQITMQSITAIDNDPGKSLQFIIARHLSAIVS